MNFKIKTISESLQLLMNGFVAAFEFAKERTPTQEERIAEAIFIEHINRYRLTCCEMHTIIETVKQAKRVAKIYVETQKTQNTPNTPKTPNIDNVKRT